MSLGEQKINDQRHLTNLWKHMARTAKKYDAIRDDVDVEIFRELTEKYNNHMVHIVFDITENSGNELYALTVTGGAHPEGYSMMPCMITSRQKHILL